MTAASASQAIKEQDLFTSQKAARSLAVLLLCLAPGFAAQAVDAGEIAELKRAVEALRAENRALAQRLSTLEGSKADSAPVTSTQPIEARVKELEIGKAAQEDAVRAIIKDSVSSLGSKINDVVSLSGTLDVVAARTRDFSSERKNSLGFGGLTFEFDVQVNDWAVGRIQLESIDGRSTLAPTTGIQTGIDRIAVETAYISVGDRLRFPAVFSAGRMVLPFGISTGHPVADVLSAGSPLTVEVFETRGNAAALSFSFPTPALGPPLPPVVAPPVRPLVLSPLVDSLARRLGYKPPPTRLKPLSAVQFTPEEPPFNVGAFVYEGLTAGGIRRHFGATAGFNAKGHCGKPYDELAGSGLCPWSLSVDVNYNSSIFNSRFLSSEYQSFLNEIGRVPAAAASVKAALGRFSLVGEWNGATKRARFVDAAGNAVAIKPAAWQVSLGWQLDWNPWVQEIGAQGTYLALGYSQSRDLAGVTGLVDGAPTRVGFVPRRRLLLTAGEWVADGLRVVVELSHSWDYAVTQGGTGKSANGIATSLTYVW